jgi:SSS family solute:Na+ symporter
LTLPGLDTAILVGYLAAVVGFGCWFVRKVRTADDFMVAGRSMPAWALGLSILGTYVSSISFLAYPGKAYAGDWNAFVFTLSLPLTLWVAAKWFVPFYRHSGEVSAYEHLEKRFGAWARTYAVVCYLLTQMARMGTILYLLALALYPMTGWDVKLIIVLTGTLVTLYTLLGGTEAVVWTDAVHSMVMVAGVVVCVAIQLAGMPQGPGQLVEIARDHAKFSLGDTGPSLTQSTVWVVLLYGIFINLQNFGIDQSYVQRYITAKSDGAAKKSLWLGGLTYLPLSAMFFFIGTALFAFYTARPELLQRPGAPARPDEVFPYFITHQLPRGLTGLVIAAIFAAAMNGFGLNTVATITLCDLYRRYVRPKGTDRESMAVLYGSTFAWGAAATGVALAMIRVKTALDVWWELAGIFSGGMLGLFLLGRLSKRANGTSAAVGVAAGVAVILWMSLSPRWPFVPQRFRSPFHPSLVIVFGTVTILLCGLAAAALRKPAPGQGFEPILPPATPAAPGAASTPPAGTPYP